MTGASGTVQVTHHDDNGTWIIALAGEHDIATSPLIDARTRDIWSRCSIAIVDLRAATFIDSSVVNWLVRTRRILEVEGGRDAVRIVEDLDAPAVGLVLDILAVRGEFACYSTTHDAVAQAPADDLDRQSVTGEVRPDGIETRTSSSPERPTDRQTGVLQ